MDLQKELEKPSPGEKHHMTYPQQRQAAVSWSAFFQPAAMKRFVFAVVCMSLFAIGTPSAHANDGARRLGSMNFQTLFEQRLGIFFYEAIDPFNLVVVFPDGREVIVATDVHATLNFPNGRRQAVRFAWDGFSTVHVAYRSQSNGVMYLWASLDGNFSRPVQVLGARTDETPSITTYPNGIGINYEGRTGDDLFFAFRPFFSSTWSGNGHLGNGARTKFGPDGACPHGNGWLLKYRGRRNTNDHYFTTFDGRRWSAQFQVGLGVWNTLCTGAPNLARSATASAQSTFRGYSAARINDGSADTTVGPSTSWANAAGSRLPQWVDLSFRSAVNMDQVHLYTSAGYPLRDYDVQLLSGSQWITVAAVRGNTAAFRVHSFAQRAATRVRILCRSGPNHQTIYARINELEVYNR